MLDVYAFIFGCLIGSFLNVVIFRVPKGEDIVFMRSSCPNCHKTVRWFQNIPLVSYLFLRGRCSWCKQSISIQYPLIELMCGLASLWLFPSNFALLEVSLYLLKFSIFCCFVAHFLIDIRHKILPDGINILLAINFLALGILFTSIQSVVLGGAIGLLFPLFVTWAFYAIKGQVGLGGGDIKLYGALGLFLGPIGILRTIFLSCLLGALVGVILIVLKKMDKNSPIAFGPYILVVAFFQIFLPQYFKYIVDLIY